jgi:hypothetical protein
LSFLPCPAFPILPSFLPSFRQSLGQLRGGGPHQEGLTKGDHI